MRRTTPGRGIAALALLVAAAALGLAAEKKHPPMPKITAPVVFGTPEADRILERNRLHRRARQRRARRRRARPRARRGRVAWRAIAQRTEALVREYDLRAEDATVQARALSGGNQQKLVLAREMSAAPRVLVAENPTRGLDIRATRAVHEQLRTAAANGTTVVVYSSDLDEVLALATRVIVVHAGQLRACSLDRDEVGRAMLGVAS